MDIRNNNLVNISSNGIKSYNNQLKSNKNMSFSGVSAQNFPLKPIIDVEKVTKATKTIQEGVKEAKDFSKIHADQKLSSDAAPLFIKGYAKYFKHVISPITEKYYVKPHVRDEKSVKKLSTCESISGLVGNSAKELTCMIFYPLMTLTNQDMSTDKKRFVGIYDFFVTCFSLSGSLMFALAKKQTDYLPVRQIAKYEKQNFTNLGKAQKGAAFVFNVALQTLLCKRILAPAFSPPLAAGVRKWLEKRDEKKAAAAGVVAQPQTDKKDEKTASTKPVEKSAAMTEAKTVTKPVEKSTEKVAEKPSVKTEQKPAAKSADKTAEKPVEKQAEKVAEKPAVKAEEKPTAKPVEKPADKVAAKPQQPEQNLFAVYKKQTQKTEKTA